MQGFLNVLKGAYPSLKQLDKSLPVKAANAIIRGSLIRVDTATNEFQLTEAGDAGAANSPGPVCYWALQAATDPDVQMAGVLTGIPCTAPMELETDQIDTNDPGNDFVVGAYVSAGVGVIKAHADDETAIGVVTNAASFRWANGIDAAGEYVGRRTGTRVQVVAIQTLYIPNLSTAV